MLAHGQHEHSRKEAPLGVFDRDQPATVALLAHDQRQGGLRHGIGEAGQGSGDLVQAPDVAEVAQRRQQMALGLEMTQDLLGDGHIVQQDGLGLLLDGLDGQQYGLQPRFRRADQGFTQALRVAAAQARQIGRGRKHRPQHRLRLMQQVAPAFGIGHLVEIAHDVAGSRVVDHRAARMQPLDQGGKQSIVDREGRRHGNPCYSAGYTTGQPANRPESPLETTGKRPKIKGNSREPQPAAGGRTKAVRRPGPCVP